MKEWKKIHVIDKNLQEIKQGKPRDYAGEVEMVGKLKIGEQVWTTPISFRNISDYESYINSIDEGYEAEDAIFNGYIYKIKTPEFILINRSQYGNGCDFKHEIIETRGINCFIPTKVYCFVICFNFMTGKDYKHQYLEFKKKRNNTIKYLD